ncbi:DDE superfamily endonuclease [Popillia japonica]|uniref:DDE superfamily endonuclease n=1 Tax=Popillia japonica TaxID=7064 RepID=A0AAW1JVV6_POPJA
MTCDILTEWFRDDFIPEVKEFRKREKKTGKVLLIIDIAPCHSEVESLNSIDRIFSVILLPPKDLQIVTNQMSKPSWKVTIILDIKLWMIDILNHVQESQNIIECDNEDVELEEMGNGPTHEQAFIGLNTAME